MKNFLAILLVSGALLSSGLVGCGKAETKQDETRDASGERLPPHMRTTFKEPQFKGNLKRR